MAYVKFKDGTERLIKAALAVQIWYVKVGLRAPDDPAQARYCEEVQTVKLNWTEAPDEYVRRHIHEIVPQALNDWAVDRSGKPVRPASHKAWDFAKKYGLWKSGKPTPLVNHDQVTLL